VLSPDHLPAWFIGRAVAALAMAALIAIVKAAAWLF
jgi:hypothetical protein